MTVLVIVTLTHVGLLRYSLARRRTTLIARQGLPLYEFVFAKRHAIWIVAALLGVVGSMALYFDAGWGNLPILVAEISALYVGYCVVMLHTARNTVVPTPLPSAPIWRPRSVVLLFLSIASASVLVGLRRGPVEAVVGGVLMLILGLIGLWFVDKRLRPSDADR